MEISRTNNTQPPSYIRQNRTHSPSFGYLPICKGKIIRTLGNGSKTYLPVDICVLREEDKALIHSIYDKWTEPKQYGNEILRNFLSRQKSNANSWSKYNYFAIIPTPETSSILSKIFHLKLQSRQEPLAIAELQEEPKGFLLKYIQTATEILDANKQAGLAPQETKDSILTISGCGRMLMYGICRFVISTKQNTLKILSANDGFYNKIFNRKDDINFHITVNSDELSELINETREKYKLLPKTITLSQDIVDEIKNNTFN